jgi:phosphatidylserine decarboxylase
MSDMVRDGIYYAFGMLLAAAVLWWLAGPAWSAAPLLPAVFFLWFFRDPERLVPAEPGLIVAPADGKVTHICPTEWNGQDCTRISIFLSVFDVHVNRSPISGIIQDVTYRRGRFSNALGAASAEDNEQNVITMQGEGMTLVFKQIAGLLARRIVFNYKAGDTLTRGQRVGLIKFGSRTDVIFPAPADLAVKTGDRVKGGSSILARTRISPSLTPSAVRQPSEAVR